MRKVCIIHVGIGNVGRTLIRQLCLVDPSIKKEYHTSLSYCGLFNSSSGVYASYPIPLSEICNDPEKNFFRIDDIEYIIGKIITRASLPFIFIDTTAADTTYPYLVTVLKKGGYVVTSNKKPLSASQKSFDALVESGKDRLFFETTVGAGLPVISTLKSLFASGDEIVQIQGCFSGTLGYIFSQMEKGVSFSDAVADARQKGFTEPDPRDDLSGTDVARKALILARVCGYKMQFPDIKLQSLYPPEMQKLSQEEFLKSISQLDSYYKKKMHNALKNGRTLRFIASVGRNACKVGVQEVVKQSDIGNLQGPDNLIVFQTKRYLQNPLVIKGPGAGVDVTAAGVVSDIVGILYRISGDRV